MKKIALIAALGLSLLSGFRSDARVNINVSFGIPVVQQSWYANDNDYVYMPDQGVYYNTRQQMYVFQDGGQWCTAQRLPARFGSMNYMNVRTTRVHDFRPFERGMDARRGSMMVQNGGFRGDQHNDANSSENGHRFDNNRTQDKGFGRGRR